MMSPDSLPEDLIEVGGFRVIRANEYFVEWRDVGKDRVAKVWVEYDNTPHGPAAWNAMYEVTSGGRIVDQGTVGIYDDFDDTLADVVQFMRRSGSGRSDMKGHVPSDLDFSGVGR